MPKAKIYPDSNGMVKLADIVKERLPEGIGFCLIVFPFTVPDDLPISEMCSYVSNAQRDDMIAFLKGTVERLEKKQDFKTPDMN